MTQGWRVSIFLGQDSEAVFLALPAESKLQVVSDLYQQVSRKNTLARSIDAYQAPWDALFAQ